MFGLLKDNIILVCGLCGAEIPVIGLKKHTDVCKPDREIGDENGFEEFKKVKKVKKAKKAKKVGNANKSENAKKDENANKVGRERKVEKDKNVEKDKKADKEKKLQEDKEVERIEIEEEIVQEKERNLNGSSNLEYRIQFLLGYGRKFTRAAKRTNEPTDKSI